jgi:hypothetical protein
MGYRVTRLDRRGARRRPDFLISDSSGPLFCSEVKTLFSGGYLSDRNAHLSTADPQFLNSGFFSTPVDFSNIDEKMHDAVDQFEVLVRDHPEYANLPYLVLFFFDFFADNFRLYPKRMESFPQVSGIGKVVVNHALKKAAHELPMEELAERARTGDTRDLPPPSKDIELVVNECAKVALPAQFTAACITYG